MQTDRNIFIELTRYHLKKCLSTADKIKFLKRENVRLSKLIALAKELKEYDQSTFWQQNLEDIIIAKIKPYQAQAELEAEENLEKIKPNNKNTTPARSPKQVIQPDTEFNTFKLLAFQKDEKYFIRNANAIMEAFQSLKGKFISEKTKYSQFTDTFSGKTISPENRISWIGTLKELKIFVQQLMEKGKMQKTRYGHWYITIKFFTHEGKEIEEKQVQNSSGSINQSRIDILIAVISKL